MPNQENEKDVAGETEIVPWSEFLENQPPGTSAVTDDAAMRNKAGNYYLTAPDLQLHCPRDSCSSMTFFFATANQQLLLKHDARTFLLYECRNCRKYWKTYALCVRRLSDAVMREDLTCDDIFCGVIKYGEDPPFGPPVPPRALRLIQPDRELFLQGRRSENLGLGIGALAYYRRVVENQWARLVGEIIKVAKVIGTSKEALALLESARNEQQFAKAVKEVRDAIPQSLLIGGQNPLSLLHSALSIALHNLTDSKCLETATNIRVVLFELAEKLSQAPGRVRSERR